MHAAEAVSSPLSIVSLGNVGGDGSVTDRATRGTWSAGRIRGGSSSSHFLNGWVSELQFSWPAPPATTRPPLHPSVRVDSNHGRDGSGLARASTDTGKHNEFSKKKPFCQHKESVPSRGCPFSCVCPPVCVVCFFITFAFWHVSPVAVRGISRGGGVRNG